VDFRGLTPSRAWEASGPQEVVQAVLREWLDDSAEVEELEDLQTDAFAGCERVGYRLRGQDRDGPLVVEQQASLEDREGRIGWMRVLCSGFRTPS
jgi:hypothetical protein